MSRITMKNTIIRCKCSTQNLHCSSAIHTISDSIFQLGSNIWAKYWDNGKENGNNYNGESNEKKMENEMETGII